MVTGGTNWPCGGGTIGMIGGWQVLDCVGPAHEGFEALVGGVVVPPDDVAADHAALGLVAGMVGAVEGEVAQGGELGLLET
ncbi:hypothetical protein GCM10022403_050610 [Streptomyces coacervatus]|uniref:Uncharacterized protein n=1 Tax=Streptomyces coacervatus TaxID=647381 RepID=A0ABP7I776_9ACTN